MIDEFSNLAAQLPAVNAIIIWTHNAPSCQCPADNRIDNESRPLVVVDRAIGDLRRGLPVILCDGPDRTLVAAAELINTARLDQLRHLGGDQLRLILSHNRAATLKIRLYTPDVVAVVGSARFSTDTIEALADPCLDLSTPLKGAL